MLTWWQAVVLGLVEGVTEYLPVSSTGHLILTAALLHLDHPETKDALDAYLIVVQGGAILAVVLLYWPRVAQMLRGLVGRDPDGLRLARNLAIAFAPAAVAGAVLGKAVKAHLFAAWPVLAALAAGGLWMIQLGRRPARGGAPITALSWRTALGIGLFQTLALWPGTSRSMVTIGGGILLGLGAVPAAEFSFLLGLPTLGAACAHDLVQDLRGAAAAHGPSMFHQLGAVPVALGLGVATLTAALAVRWLVSFLGRHGLAPFGWYRLALAATLAGLFLSGIVRLG
ncbi:MAG TPA: undecaprenyl-diphosphate phosphatase [Candidatus Binatia bacterium]|nr:undecaprenyl-diphosphate phosphatase [Candidatus Binatia bacterium]